MFIRKLSLPRRTFLRGMGATVALPLLEAMVPALTPTVHTAGNPQIRFGAVYVPHGVILDEWDPVAEGVGFELPTILKPLQPFKDSLTVVTNLKRGGGNNHAVACSAWLSGSVAKATEAEDVLLGTTIDQLVAKQIGQSTPFPSLELATEDFTGFVGGCSTGYSCAYMNTISWATPTTPLPMEINPRVVFERLFGRAGTAAQRRARMSTDKSILDAITTDVERLQGRVGARDRVRLNEYLENVREIERRIARMEAQASAQFVSLDAPIGIPEIYGEHASLMFDLAAVAYQTDLTRVFSFMMARDLSTKTYPQLGVTEGHHDVSHHGGNPQQIVAHTKINTYHVQLFARFLGTLRDTPDGDGSLLDHSLIFYGSGMGNGNIHGPERLPLAAVGRGLSMRHGHIRTAEHTPLANVWQSVAHKFDSPIERFGEATGSVALF
ncbi:MAG: hypothetical protein C5B57_02860 [Blastocatellia bacterium]|nr:MAG: hypothetical protein C5B57_02860 [Blastocatellia bacterium]